MSVRRAVLVFALCTLATTGLDAQAADAPRAPSCLDSIPAAALRPSVVYLVSQSADSLNPVRLAALPAIDQLTQAVAQRVRLLVDTGTARLPAADRLLGWRDLGGIVEVVLNAEGTVRWRPLPVDTLEAVYVGRAGRDLMIRALDAMRADGETFVLPDNARRDSITFSLGYEFAARDEHDKVKTLHMRVGIPAFTIPLPWSTPVSSLRSDGPRYPARLRQAGYQAEVLARFVVNAEGHAEPRTFSNNFPAGAVHPTGVDADAYAEFVEAVRKALPRLRFEPARVAGCAVPQVVQQPFTFRLTPF